MEKLMSRYRVQRFLELVSPLPDSIMRKICWSHNKLMDRRSELRYTLQLTLSHVRAIRDGEKTAMTNEDLIALMQACIDTEELLDFGVQEESDWGN